MARHTRRDCLIKVCGLGGAALALRAKAAGPPEKYPRNLTKADIDRWMTELSNWGRWGKDDQAGTINLITPAKRKQATALVKDSVPVSMSVDADISAQREPAAPAAKASLSARVTPGSTRCGAMASDEKTASPSILTSFLSTGALLR